MAKENIVTHVCEKEAEIAILITKVDEIHKAIIGNGQPGILAEFNQWKGAVKLISWICAIGGISGVAALVRTFI